MTRKLLIVVNIPRFFVSHRLPLALAAREVGYDVHVATAGGDEEQLATIQRHGLMLHRIPLDQHGTRPLSELRTLFALILLLLRLRPDLVHNVSIKPVLYGGLAARLTRRRTVVAALSGLGRTFRDDRGAARDPGRLLTLALRAALPRRTTHLLLQNQDDLQVMQALGLATAERASVIPGSGVDLTVFHPARAPARTTAEEQDPVTVLYAGRLMWQKGLGDFVTVARRLSQDARFVVAGYTEEGSPDAVPIAQVEDWVREGVIEYIGARTDMPDVIAGADVVVLPTVYGEGVPRTLIEAAATGRPIVTTDTPGCRDICRDGVNGILVAPGDSEGLIEAVRTLIEDVELRDRMGIEGRMLAERSFGLRTVLDQTLALYASLLDETR